MSVDNIVSPTLIFHCKADNAVPWQNAVEMFTAMRRLGKKVWMLQYDNGTHLLTKKNDIVDFNKRVTQFFNHYLKNTPAPVWMTRGIPADLKGKTLGYETEKK
jgi:dipeptidyl aminopeptidase/acylaminoacyl peptidase